MLMGVFSLSAVMAGLSLSGQQKPAALSRALVMGLVGIAVVLLALGPILEAKLRGKDDEPLIAKARLVDSTEAFQRWSQPRLVGLAATEAAGLIGGVLILLTGSLVYLLLTALSLASLALSWKRGRDELAR
jgi:hypothetical protein